MSHRGYTSKEVTHNSQDRCANEGHRGAWQVRVPSNFFFVVMQSIYSLAVISKMTIWFPGFAWFSMVFQFLQT